MKSILIPKRCRECGSTQLTWICFPINLGGVQDGRIKMHEVGVKFALGCDECSETVLLVDGDEIAEMLNSPEKSLTKQ